MIVYKVVKKQDNKAVSSYVSTNSLCCEYKLNTTTQPHKRNFPLFAFKALEDANEYKFIDKDFYIFKCKAVISKTKLPHRVLTHRLDIALCCVNFSSFTKMCESICARGFKTMSTTGFILCSSITPIEIIR